METAVDEDAKACNIDATVHQSIVNKIIDGPVPVGQSGDDFDNGHSKRHCLEGREDQWNRVLTLYPYCGTIYRCTDKGYGFLRKYSSVRRHAVEEWFHISDHADKHLDTLEGLEGKICAFMIGGHPGRYKAEKPNWSKSIVQWRLLDDIAPSITPDQYNAERERALLALDRKKIEFLLSADWFVEFWKKKAKKSPQAILIADSLLDKTVEGVLTNSSGVEELITLLAAVCKSPWYCIEEKGRQKICERFFKPAELPPLFFVSKACIAACNGYADIQPWCGDKLNSYIQQASMVAIDLESDGKSIRQFGWKNAYGSGKFIGDPHLNSIQLDESAEKCFCEQFSPAIAGHNLIAWDLPILKQNNFQFPNASSFWDTLVASWILEPWRYSHALVVGTGAHDAEVDAVVCFELFEKQIKRLSTCLKGMEYDIHALVDRLFDNSALLSEVEDRDYPDNLQSALDADTLYPSSMAREFAWQKGCHLRSFAPENILSDPLLSPSVCRKVAIEDDGLYAKVVAIIVSDAERNGVDVRLSFLPLWLVGERLRSALKAAHDIFEGGEVNEEGKTVYLAEDLFKLDDAEVHRLFNEKKFSIWGRSEVAVAWQNARRCEIAASKVRNHFQSVSAQQRGRALLQVSNGDGPKGWLLYEPPGLLTAGASWSLLPDVPDWLQIDSENGRNKPALDIPVLIPRWRDGSAASLDVDRIFISPDTENRPIYLADLTHCFLNLLKLHQEEDLLLVAMRWPTEAEQLQQNFVQLGLSSRYPGSPVKILEQMCNNGQRSLACSRADVPKYIQAALDLRKRIHVVLDELPLYNWSAILNIPDNTDGVVKIEPFDDDLEVDNAEHKHVSFGRAILKGHDINSTVSLFISGWLQGILGSADSGVTSCIVLDTRLSEHHAAMASFLPKVDIPFYALDQLLDKDELEVFREVCYPGREEQDIPNDYESYQHFLKEHWGFDDFRQGTQRQAIKKLIESDRDLLIRMPTGGGKSIVFHLPALFKSSYSKRLTIVITPLQALMRDQAEGLWHKNFVESVDYLSGGRDAWINHEVYQGILDGRIHLVFVAPERFRIPQFLDALERRRNMDGGLEFIVFDEVHCVSEWGFDFRPDYLNSARYIAEMFKQGNALGNPHRLLLTSATVTRRNRDDLKKELRLGEIAPDELPDDMPHPIQPFIVLDSCDCEEDEETPNDDKFYKIVEILKGLDLDNSAALVFVRRKKDCHRLSEALNEYADQENSDLKKIYALPFHAGLSEALKSEASDQLKIRQANVLVCTKAFGMGMDIPHLHACIHHRPPTYLEDYLQEVGRIGRDEEERLRTGNEIVRATLLYNRVDIERNLAQLHDSSVKPTDLQELFKFCLKGSVYFDSVKKSLFSVPSRIRISETKTFGENQVANGLFWLERMGILRIEGTHPPLLKLTKVDLNELRNVAKGKSRLALTSGSLLGMIEETDGVVSGFGDAKFVKTLNLEDETLFGRVVKGLLRGVFSLVSSSKKNQYGSKVVVATAEPEKVEVNVAMSELIARCGGVSMDNIFADLIELSNDSILAIEKELIVSKSGLPSEVEFWDLLGQAIKILLQPTNERVESLSRKEFSAGLQQWYSDFLVKKTGKVLDLSQKRRVNREVYRAIKTSLMLVRNAGIRIREKLSGSSNSCQAIYIRFIPDSIRSTAVRSVEENIHLAKVMVDYFTKESVKAVSNRALLTDVMKALPKGTRISKVKNIVKIVEFTGFFMFEGLHDEWGKLVSLSARKLEAFDSDGGMESIVQQTYAEMLGKYEFQVLRAQAMVLFAIMPGESRKEYIDRYFDCLNAEEMKKLIEDTVGELGEEILGSNPMFKELRSHVRQERFTEEMDNLNERQKKVCLTPFDRKILVNAGPGSGKTYVLTMRCAHLIHAQRIDPASILVLAFNRAVVYEIRDRIRDLFRALGYGTYTNKLDVTTFHSFALRYQENTELHAEEAIGNAVHAFAERMKDDEEFAREIGNRYQAILIDEFQDMNEDFYNVVKNLIENCSGGGMVIGDDDQDILTWNRKDWSKKYGKKCPLEAVHYFSDFKNIFIPEVHNLIENYRSVPEIVMRSNGMIEKVAVRIGFSRMKDDVDLTAFRKDHGEVIMPFDVSLVSGLIIEALDQGENVAVLCRSNRECRQIFDALSGGGSITSERVELLGAVDFSLYQLRHCGALLDICRNRRGYDFVEHHVLDEMIEEYNEKKLADATEGQEYLITLYKLVREEVGRPRVRDLQTFIEEMHASDVERLKAKLKNKIGIPGDTSRLTIATVHKVKGLEYDTVFVMPSSESFPFGGTGIDVPTPIIDSAEEARICYVAMTRAKNRLYVGWESREKRWINRNPFKAAAGITTYHMSGTPSEMFVSWPGVEFQVRTGLQDYIEKRVRLGDTLTRNGNDLQHDGRPVAKLSGRTALKLGPIGGLNLRVSNVIRYTCGEYFRAHNLEFWKKLDESIKQQGWFYTVLAEEC